MADDFLDSDFGGDFSNQTDTVTGDAFGGFDKVKSGSRSMIWHKVLTFFLLWLGVVANLYSGVSYMRGTHYGNALVAGTLYTLYPSMKTLDIIMGLLCIGVALLGVITAVMLLQYNRLGPLLLLALYAATAGLLLLYTLGASAVLGSEIWELMGGRLATQFAISGAMITINKTYYDRRAYMFK